MHTFTVNPGWRVLLTDLDLQPQHILRRAGLPEDLFGREQATLSTNEYFRLWRGIEAEAHDPLLPLRVGSVISVEAFTEWRGDCLPAGLRRSALFLARLPHLDRRNTRNHPAGTTGYALIGRNLP